MRISLSPRVCRTLLVWLHVVFSVSWLSQAVTLGILGYVSSVSSPGPTKMATAHTAELLDGTVLVVSANLAALSGFLLAATTNWGYFHHWWVAVKFVVTIVQLNIGIFVLSAALHEVAAAARDGRDGPVGIVIGGAAIMASALAFQVWVSLGKPWGRTPLARRAPRPVAAPGWLLALAVGALLTDVAVAAVLAQVTGPIPICSLLVLITAIVWRRREFRRVGGAAPAPRPPAVSQPVR